MTSIVIVDDHPTVRAGLRAGLEDVPDFAVAGEAGDGLEALALIAAIRPDIVLLDIKLPGINGLVLAKHIRETYPRTAVIVVSFLVDHRSVLGAIQAGAAAYCAKDMKLSEIARTIQRVAAGESLMDDIIAAQPEVARLLNSSDAALLQGNQQRMQLSLRGVEILDGIVQGEGNKTIARRLHTGEQTVKSHVAAIMRQLGADNRTTAAMTAVRRGWVNVDP